MRPPVLGLAAELALLPPRSPTRFCRKPSKVGAPAELLLPEGFSALSSDWKSVCSFDSGLTVVVVPVRAAAPDVLVLAVVAGVLLPLVLAAAPVAAEPVADVAPDVA